MLFPFPLFEIVFTDKLSFSFSLSKRKKKKKRNDSVENLQDAWKNLISTRRVYDRWSKIWSESRRNEVRPRWKGIRFASGEPNRSLPPPQSSLRHDTVYAWDFPIFYFVYRFRGRKDCVCYEEEKGEDLVALTWTLRPCRTERTELSRIFWKRRENFARPTRECKYIYMYTFKYYSKTTESKVGFGLEIFSLWRLITGYRGQFL